jgi:hypothetical protein
MELTESYALMYPNCVLYILGFAAMGSAEMSWMVETIPSVGIGMALALGWFSGGCISLFSLVLMETLLGPTGMMIFYTLWCFVGIFILDWVIIETKGKQMDEVEQEYLNFKYRPFRLCPRKVLG